MSRTFLDFNRQAAYLMPPSIEDWLPQGHLARFIVEIVDALVLSSILKSYSGIGGKSAYHPKMLTALLFYGYATGTFSSRKIEQATHDSVPFRFIAANTHPDHDTIATFRKRFLDELEALFVDILSMAQTMGVLKVGHISLDGTKIQASASKHKALSFEYACKLEEQLHSEVQELLKMAEEADAQTDTHGLNLPEEIQRREDRLKRIEEAKCEMERRAKVRYEKERAEYEEKVRAREEKERRTGKRPGGKAPRPPAQSTPSPKDQVNLTDGDSRIMPDKGGFTQGYNAQAGVEHESRLILHHHLTQNCNDKQEMEPFLESMKEKEEQLGKIKGVAADNGYYSEANINACEEEGIPAFISQGREKHNLPLKERLAGEQESLPPKEDDSLKASPLEKHHHRMSTPQGKSIYKKRKSVVEPVFGIIKEIMGFRRFLLRGLEQVKGEWSLVCLAYNLKRLHVLAKGA